MRTETRVPLTQIPVLSGLLVPAQCIDGWCDYCGAHAPHGYFAAKCLVLRRKTPGHNYVCTVCATAIHAWYTRTTSDGVPSWIEQAPELVLQGPDYAATDFCTAGSPACLRLTPAGIACPDHGVAA